MLRPSISSMTASSIGCEVFSRARSAHVSSQRSSQLSPSRRRGPPSATADSSELSSRLRLRLPRPMAGRFQLEGMPTYRRVSRLPLPIPGRGGQGPAEQGLGGRSGRSQGGPEQVVQGHLHVGAKSRRLVRVAESRSVLSEGRLVPTRREQRQGQ